MKKTRRLKQLLALILAGALTVGYAGISVFGADFGDAAVEASVEEETVAEEATEESNISADEEAGASAASDDVAVHEDNENSNVEVYTVTLDANGGYFADEWDDILNEKLQFAEILNKTIPAGGTVTVFPDLVQENEVIAFLGWSLERNGELISREYEEYAPAASCTLYAVWQIEETSEENNQAVTENNDVDIEDIDDFSEKENDYPAGDPDKGAGEGSGADTEVKQDAVPVQDEINVGVPKIDFEDNSEPEVQNEVKVKEDDQAQDCDKTSEPIMEDSGEETISTESYNDAADSFIDDDFTLSTDGTLVIRCNDGVDSKLFSSEWDNNLHEYVPIYKELFTRTVISRFISANGSVHEWIVYLNPNVKKIVIDEGDADSKKHISVCELIWRFPNVEKITANVLIDPHSSGHGDGFSSKYGSAALEGEDILNSRTQGWNSRYRNKIYGELYYSNYTNWIVRSKDLTIASFNYDVEGCIVDRNGEVDEYNNFEEQVINAGFTFEEITCKLDKLLSAVANGSVFYDGESHKAAIDEYLYIKCENKEKHGSKDPARVVLGYILTENEHYTVDCYNERTKQHGDVTNAGTVTVTVKGINGHVGTLTGYYIIKPQALNSKNISLPETSYVYSGKARKPSVTVKSKEGKTLKQGTDYTIAYKNNTKVGTATVTVTGKGNYTGSATAAFKITKANQNITVKAAASSIAAGKTTTISVSGAKGNKSFKSSDTNIATVDKSTGKVTAKKVGKVTITATSAATANYKAASKTVTIKVVPAATSSLKADNQATGIKLTWKKVAGANAYFIYRGSTQIAAIKNGSTVTYTDKKANTNGTKYTYKIIASASSTGRSTLSKSVTTYCVARPAIRTLANSVSSKMTVKWGKNAKANGYQIQYCPDKTFKTGNKSVSITSVSTVSKVIGSLAKGKTYYVRVRTYKTAGSTKYFSAWSSVKSVKITK